MIAFVWSIKTGQQEDLITPAMRILQEDEKTNNL
ncbi:MAG: cbb3-type cytochrome oxidase assembly protein CcoS [Aquirufa sp.]